MSTNSIARAGASSLHVDRVEMIYGGKTVLSDLSFEVRPGEIVSLVGPNGAGKSTTLRLAAGIERPVSGDVTFRGQHVDEVDAEFRSAVGVVLDDFGFLPDLTAGEHLDLLARAHRTEGVAERVIEVLKALSIDHLADQMPVTLSSGQRHRLALASVMVRDTLLLILDEPEQRMDAAGRAWLATYLRQVAEGGVAVLMASHDAELLDRTVARRVQLDTT